MAKKNKKAAAAEAVVVEEEEEFLGKYVIINVSVLFFLHYMFLDTFSHYTSHAKHP